MERSTGSGATSWIEVVKRFTDGLGSRGMTFGGSQYVFRIVPLGRWALKKP